MTEINTSLHHALSVFDFFSSNPNGPGLPHWKQYDEGTSHPYMALQSLKSAVGTNYREDYTDFWDKDVRSILNSGCGHDDCAVPIVG